jgi:hypothetical protein
VSNKPDHELFGDMGFAHTSALSGSAELHSRPESLALQSSMPVYYPMLIASDVMQNDFDESKVMLLTQAWKLALDKAKSLGWLDEPEQKRKRRRRII